MQDNLISSKLFGANFQVVPAAIRLCWDDLESGFGLTGRCWGEKNRGAYFLLSITGLVQKFFSLRLYIRFKSLASDFVYSFGRAALLLLVEV